jgi:Ras-related protein Rab-7A
MQIGDDAITLQIWDTAGQERFQSLGQAFYRGADACVLVYDVTSVASFEKLEGWREQFLRHGDVGDARDFPFVVLGNKSDLDPSKHAVSSQMVKTWCESKGGIPHFLVRSAGSCVPSCHLA